MCWAASAGPTSTPCFLLFLLPSSLKRRDCAVPIGGAIRLPRRLAMFQKKIYYFDGKDRYAKQPFSEALDDAGLLLTIFGGIKAKEDVPMLGLFITAGPGSRPHPFANPASRSPILHGRSRRHSWPAFMGGRCRLIVGR